MQSSGSLVTVTGSSVSSTVVNLTIAFVDGGPTLPHMRARLGNELLVAELLGARGFLLSPTLRYSPLVIDPTLPRSNGQLVTYLVIIQAAPVAVLFIGHLGVWALVILWSISKRNNGYARVCLSRNYRSWAHNYLPTSETTQVLTLTSFLQLILALYLHIAFTGTVLITLAHAFLLAWLGVGARALLNAWVRGSDLDFRAALSVDQIHTQGPVEWIDEDRQEPAMLHFDVGSRVRIMGKSLFVNGKRRRVRWPAGVPRPKGRRGGDGDAFAYSGMAGKVLEVEEEVGGLVTLEGGVTFLNPALPSMVYAQPHEPGGIRLRDLAAEDWEKKHLAFERQFDDFDVFDDGQLQPEKDPSLLASFLNSNVMQILRGKGVAGPGAAKGPPPIPPEQLVTSVEVPAGLPKELLRDALLQWRLRHTAHPVESEALDWLLGQLDPTGFELLHVKVPSQLRALLLEALIAHSQRHAELQMDACHAMRVQVLLQQLERGATAGVVQRYQPMDVELPADEGGSSDTVRHLLHAALTARIKGKGGGGGSAEEGGVGGGGAEITQEEGYLLQSVMGVLADSFSLVAMPHVEKPASQTNAEGLDAQVEGLKEEILRREDEIRKDAEDYLYDDEIYTPVMLVSHERPPDRVEQLIPGVPGQARKGRAMHQVPPALLKRQPTGSSRNLLAKAVSTTIAPIRLTRGASLAAPSAAPAAAAAPAAEAFQLALPAIETVVEEEGGIDEEPSFGIEKPAGSTELPPEGTAAPLAAPAAAPALAPEEDLLVELAAAAPPAAAVEATTATPRAPPALSIVSPSPSVDSPSIVPVGTPARLAATPPPSPPEQEFLALSPSDPRSTATHGGVSGPSRSPQPVPRLKVDGVATLSRAKSSAALSSPSTSDAIEEKDEEAARPPASGREAKGRVRGWLFRRRERKREKIRHEMPCWKQYLQVTIGTGLMLLGTVNIIVNLSLDQGDERKLLEPIPTFLAFISWGCAMPSSILLHYMIRAGTRRLRIYAAMRRGYRVKGAIAPTAQQRRRGGPAPRELASADGEAPAPAPRQLRPQSTAYLNPLLDAMPNWLEERERAAGMLDSSIIDENGEVQADLPTHRKQADEAAKAEEEPSDKGRADRASRMSKAGGRELAKSRDAARKEAEEMANRRLNALRQKEFGSGHHQPPPSLATASSAPLVGGGQASHSQTSLPTTPPTRIDRSRSSQNAQLSGSTSRADLTRSSSRPALRRSGTASLREVPETIQHL